MFRSIHRRLAASYLFVTLLAVTAVGLLALAHLKQDASRQQARYLRLNAEAIAAQALPLLSSGPDPASLDRLAQTAGFLGNLRVQIYDADENLLADSGAPGENNQLTWLQLPEKAADASPGKPADGWLDQLLPGRSSGFLNPQAQTLSDLLQTLPAGAEVSWLRRETGAWGSWFVAGGGREPQRDLQEKPAVGTPETNLAASAGQADLPRSDQVLRYPVGPAGAPSGYVELSQAVDLSVQALNPTRQAFLWGAAGAALLAGLVGLWLGRRMSRPLAELGAAATRMSAGDLAARAPVRGRDEIGALAGRFNQMAAQLQTSFLQLAAERDTLRRFIADASHELRTPITALKNFNAILQDPTVAGTPAQAEFLAESQVQIERLEWITRNLLDLSRLDAGLAALNRTRFSLADLLESAAAPFRPIAAEKGLRLAVQVPSPAPILEADRPRLELAISNLLDNAVKFTPPGGRIDLGAAPTGPGAQIWVQDSGPGIAPEDLPRVFERFYRGRGVQAPGSGLGLAIVQAIVQAHGGRVTASSPAGSGARFTIDLN